MKRLVPLLVAMLVPGFTASAQEFFTDCARYTGKNATIIIDASANHVLGTDGSIQPGDEIGIYTEDGQCVGADVWTGQNIAISVWGDDPMQDDKLGLLHGETFMVRVWDQSDDQLYGTDYGTVTYEMSATPPFLPYNTYVNDGLYMTNRIEARAEIPNGKNKIRVKSPKGHGSEHGNNNTAMFSISREGPVNEALVVNFEFGGDAEAGNDFEPLETHAAFQPGQRSAFLVLLPTLDNLVEGTETVVLTLLEDDGYELIPDSVSASATIDDSGATVDLQPESTTDGFLLAAAYPNPFAERTTLKFKTDRSQQVQVDVFNVIGKRVAAIYSGTVQAGIDYDFIVDANDLPDGLYLIRVTGGRTSVRSVVLRR